MRIPLFHVLSTCVVLIASSNIIAQEQGALLKTYTDSLRYSQSEDTRFLYNDSFTNLLKEMLDDESPFDLNLDSIKTKVMVLNSEDERMRLISWVVVNDKEEYYNYGVVIHRKRKRSTQRVFWLNDHIEEHSDSLFEEYNEENWPGALYYRIQHFKKRRKHYYCVLGMDGNTSFSNRKIIDVLSVDRSGELHIGAPVFHKIKYDYTPQYRVFFEYADQSSMLLRFEKEEKLIVFDKLMPSNPSAKGKYQYYIPSGGFDYYKLARKGKWIFSTALNEFDLQGNE
jgi:hypothetical protein